MNPTGHHFGAMLARFLGACWRDLGPTKATNQFWDPFWPRASQVQAKKRQGLAKNQPNATESTCAESASRKRQEQHERPQKTGG